MRRVALVAVGAEGDAAQAWLESLPDLAVRRAPSLAEVVLDATDLIWAHGPVAPYPPLLPWIEAGGRLLASLDAALLPGALGLDPSPPDQQLDLTWRAADGGPRGLAAFGPHPLFDGLAQGADVWAPREGERYRLIGYGTSRPRGGTVIAVERSMLRLDASRAIAWEYALGDGGILCLGAYVFLAAAAGRPGHQLRTVLRNAILGAAIPHRDRSATASGWPTPGTAVRNEPGHSIPLLPDLNGAWAPSSAPIAIESDASSDDPWTLPGRRIVALGGERTGVREIWAHPCRLMHDGRIAISGRPAEVTGFRAAPDELVRTLGKGDAVVTERWLTALELPVFVWELEALRADAVLEAHWITDLRRAWPYPAGCFGDLQYTLSRDRTQLYVGVDGGTVQALFSVSGGQLAASPAEGPALRVAGAGTGRIRIAAVFGSDRTDLERTIKALDRKHFFGLRAQRSQHADQIREYGASLETPDAACNAAFEWAKVRTDGCIVGTPGVGRSVVEGYPASGADVRPGGGWYTGAGGCRAALGLLAAGDRDAARDVLKFLLFTFDPAGRPIAEHSTSGLAHYEDPAAAPLLLLLAVRLADWAADLPYLGRHWEALQRVYRGCIEPDSEGGGLARTAAPEDASTWVMALEGLEALAEELGYPVFAEEVRVRAGKARAEVGQRRLAVPDRADATRTFDEGAHRRLSRLAATLRLGAKGAFAGESATLVDAAGPASEFLRLVVEGLWGVTPAALDGAVRIAPSLPADWPEMTLHRLRVGRTVLNARVRRRPECLEARIQRIFGPRLHVALTFPGAGKPSAISVDDVMLGGAQAAFEAEGIHEVVFHYSGTVRGKR